MTGTKVMEPMRGALPPVAVQREVLSRVPTDATTKPPLLFVHGMCHGAWCFDEHWMPAAAAAGWPCYAVSLRGHGASEGHGDIRRWKLRDYEHDVMQTIIELPAPPVLIGHSMGALIVRRILARYPARAGVLLAPAGARNGAAILATIARHHPSNVARATALQPVRFSADDLFAQLDASQAERFVARMTDESPLAQLETIFAPRPQRSTAPVLVMGGARDRLVPAHDVVRTAKTYGTRARLFSAMGHDLMLDGGWDHALDVMLGWLDEQVPAGQAARR